MVNLQEMFKNKALIYFFKRALLFSLILFGEVTFLTMAIDFQFVDFGNALIQTNVHFVVYILFLVFFITVYKDLFKIKKLKKINIRRFAPLFFLNIVSVVGFYKLAKYFMNNPSYVSIHPLTSSFGFWAFAIATGAFLLFAFFDVKYVRYFIKKFSKQLGMSGAIAVFFLFALRYAYRLWPLLSGIVAKMVYILLDLFFKGAVFRMDGQIPIVGIPAITAKVYAPCSGIEGMGLFLLLFTVLVLMEYRTMNRWKILLLYPIGVLGAFVVNIFRTFFIFTAGHFTSAEFAVGAFHSNVGWILFTVYFLGFIYCTYPWLRK